MTPSSLTQSPWPALEYDAWRDTQATLHRWTQIVGKIRLRQTPWVNHSWHVPLYLTARGLTTTPMSYESRIFEIQFDFIDHQLRIETTEGRTETLELAPRAVADFYQELFARLDTMGLPISIRTMPNEIPDTTPLDQDWIHATYDREQVARFWGALAQADRVLKTFRARFIGKCSPVHFFWGGFDLAVTRFSGRRAPPHPGGIPNLPDWITREAYSHEVSSCGFWPGGEAMATPVFYAYAYPEPEGFKSASIRPAGARYDSTFGEYVLPYDEVRQATSSDGMLLEFLQSCYEAAADLGGWDRRALEQDALPPGAEPSPS
jgi:hypothetical protein